MGHQLELRPVDWALLGEQLRALLAEVVNEIGVKEVCYDLDVDKSTLLHALQGRERHYARVDWLPYLITRGKLAADDVVRMLAGLRSLDVRPAERVTPEEELAAIKAAIAEECGPGMRDMILRAAKRVRR